VLALSKIDAVGAEELEEKAGALESVAGAAPLLVSAATGKGVPEVLAALAREVEAMREAERQDALPRAEHGWLP